MQSLRPLYHLSLLPGNSHFINLDGPIKANGARLSRRIRFWFRTAFHISSGLSSSKLMNPILKIGITSEIEYRKTDRDQELPGQLRESANKQAAVAEYTFEISKPMSIRSTNSGVSISGQRKSPPSLRFRHLRNRKIQLPCHSCAYSPPFSMRNRKMLR
jgi:hypothetical protein